MFLNLVNIPMLICSQINKYFLGKKEAPADQGAVPAYLLDREHETQVRYHWMPHVILIDNYFYYNQICLIISFISLGSRK